MRELDKIIQNYRPRYEANIQFLDIGFIVRTNSAELFHKLSAYFAGWEPYKRRKTTHVIHAVIGEGILERDKLVDVPRRPGKQVKEAYYHARGGSVVLKKKTGVVIYIKDSERYVVGNLVENLNQLINQINEIFIEEFMKRGYLLVHGSAVVNRRGHGIAFCSDSGVGKSTIAVALLAHGFKFLSNDRILLKAHRDYITMVGVPKKPRINPGTILAIPSLHDMLSVAELTRYSSMDKEQLWHLESKHDVEVNNIFGTETIAQRGTLKALYLLDWKRIGTELIINEMPPIEGLKLLRPNVLNLNSYRKYYNDPLESEVHLFRISQLTKIYHIQGGVNIEGLCKSLTKTR
jgi:HprK-related kinase B